MRVSPQVGQGEPARPCTTQWSPTFVGSPPPVRRRSSASPRRAPRRSSRAAAPAPRPQRPQAGEGRDLGVVEGVVGVAPAHAGHRALVPEDGVHPPAVLRRAAAAPGTRRCRARARAWPVAVVARRQHPPARLALGAELLEQEGDVVEPQAEERALDLRRLGRLLDVDAPALREVDEHAVAAAERPHEELAPPADPLDGAPHQRRRVGHGLQPRPAASTSPR